MNSPIYTGLPKKKHHKELRIAVCKSIDEMETGTRFSGLDLYALVVRRNPADFGNCFLETIMRYARMYRRDKFSCIDRANSIYEKVGDCKNE